MKKHKILLTKAVSQKTLVYVLCLVTIQSHVLQMPRCVINLIVVRGMPALFLDYGNHFLFNEGKCFVQSDGQNISCCRMIGSNSPAFFVTEVVCRKTKEYF